MYHKKWKLNTIQDTITHQSVNYVKFNDLPAMYRFHCTAKCLEQLYPIHIQKFAYMKTVKQRSRDKEVIKKIYFLYGFMFIIQNFCI